MSSNTNSIAPYLEGTTRQALEAIGITQFPSATEWYQIIGGLIVQGGYVAVASSSVQTVNLVAPYEKQTLGVWLQTEGASHNAAHVDGVTLSSFEIHNGGGIRSYYWLSLGV
jgi:hypothetical protein